jgi:Protein of unknown function (DUF2786)
MGKNNQQRRAAKRRERLRRRSTDIQDRRSGNELDDGQDAFDFAPDGYGAESWTTSQIDEEELLRHQANRTLGEQIALAGRVERSAVLVELVHSWLASQSAWQQQILDEQISLRFMALLTALWERGWQPADVLHAARRLDGRSTALMAALITEQAHRAQAFERAPTSWLSQLRAAERDAAAARLSPNSISGVFLAAAAQVRAGSALVVAWTTALRLASHLEKLPALQQLVDPPSAWGKSRQRRPEPSDSDRARILGKIRALLAKAEGTTYAAEAEALTAKAQDLMTRHAIDEALLHAHDDEPVDVTSLRVHISAPYPSEKVRLLNRVALANRCRLIWLQEFAIATLVGTPVDVDQVELLFTSLLVQATRAMVEAGASRPGSFDRSTSFRRSFLASYAVRIGERLTESAGSAASSYGAELVPVMQRQAHAVGQEFERLFPNTYEVGSSYTYSQRGWQAGRAAADRANFVAGRLAAS